MFQVFTVNKDQLISSNHIPRPSLPRRLGGIVEVNHREWIAKCLQKTWGKSECIDNDIAAFMEHNEMPRELSVNRYTHLLMSLFVVGFCPHLVLFWSFFYVPFMILLVIWLKMFDICRCKELSPHTFSCYVVQRNICITIEKKCLKEIRII